jgi:hypothetical protein
MEKEEERLATFAYWDTFSVCEWYPIIAEHTFPTTFVAVSQEEAREMLRLQMQMLETGQTDVDMSSLGPLLARMEEAVAEVGSAVVKMSDRSPKDAAFARGRVEKVLREDFATAPRTLVTVYRAMMRSLRCDGRGEQQVAGREALLLLLDSFRVLEDVRQRLLYADQGHPWRLDVCVRKFDNRLDPVVEYRCFARGTLLVAVGQYIHDCCVAEICESHEEHAQAIQISWNRVSEALAAKYAGLVIDFAIVDGEAVIVELNPFDESTDACLFNYTLNKTLLEVGPDVPTFRGTTFAFKYVESPGKATKTQERWWRKILETVA